MSDYLKVPELHEPLIPLSILELDLAEAPRSGWAAYLAGQGISIEFDDVGRRAISRGDAKKLLDQQRQAEIRRQDQLARLEQQAVEADELRRAQIWKGVPADSLPVGVSASDAIVAAAKDAQPKRVTPFQEALAGESLTYHTWGNENES
jgi:hypothetical protein